VDGGTERNAGILNLTVAKTNVSQIYAETGVKFATEIVQDNFVLRPTATVGYRHLLAQSGVTTGAFLAATGQTFAAGVAPRARSSFLFSTGLEFHMQQATASLNYDGAISGNTMENEFSANLSFQF
jgi:uncharacterized protein with beta-barrel porin domain